MVIRTDTFDKGLKEELDECFDEHFEASSQYKDVFVMKDTDDAYEEDEKIQYADQMEVVSEGGAYPRTEIEPVWTKRYTVETYKNEHVITKEALADLKYKKMFDAMESLGQAANRTYERSGASFFYNGLAGSETTPDGVAIFSTAHVIQNPLNGASSTASNKSVLALNPTNLKTVLTAMRRTVDEHGSLVVSVPDQLVVTPDLDFMAHQIVQSLLENETADNNINVLKGRLKVIVMDYFAEAPANSTTMWGLRNSKRAKNKWFNRQKLEKHVERDPSTGNWLYQVDARWVRGASDWRHMYFSTGAGS